MEKVLAVQENWQAPITLRPGSEVELPQIEGVEVLCPLTLQISTIAPDSANIYRAQALVISATASIPVDLYSEQILPITYQTETGYDSRVVAKVGRISPTAMELFLANNPS